jgi:MFS family permease
MNSACKLINDLRGVLTLTVIVAGLGYFVDLYDITMFGVVRVTSLKDLGLADPQELLAKGLGIYNAGMIGMMIGGVLWGWLSDRRGRLSVMFGSILLYSAANIANAFVTDVNMYALCRFLGGVGLAGELGAAVTLVAESLPTEKRGLGTTLVATMGMFGIIGAALIGKLLTWQMAYISGGVMGILLLLARLKISESHLFKAGSGANRGNLRLLLQWGNLKKYLSCIAIGIPVYFTTGILFTFAPELTAGLRVQGAVTAGSAILYGSIGLTLGDLFSGILSQKLKSRRLAVALCLSVGFVLMWIYGAVSGLTSDLIYILCFCIGTTVGYWAVLVTMAAEQFGTNIRGTVATTVPNFVRGSAVLAVSGFAVLKGYISVPAAALTIGTVCFGLAFLGLYSIKETFLTDLNFEEEML